MPDLKISQPTQEEIREKRTQKWLERYAKLYQNAIPALKFEVMWIFAEEYGVEHPSLPEILEEEHADSWAELVEITFHLNSVNDGMRYYVGDASGAKVLPSYAELTELATGLTAYHSPISPAEQLAFRVHQV